MKPRRPDLGASRSGSAEETMSKRFALVGCNTIARKHAEVIVNQVERASLAAVCDIVPERAQAFGDKYGVPAFTNYHRMMEQEGDRIDIVSVLTPSGCHCPNVVDLAPYGKPLVVEKPIALRLEDADEMIKACDLHGTRLFVVKQNRYNVPIIHARRALEMGRFGKLVLGTVRCRWKRDQAYYDSADWRGTWQYDGGVFSNQASHHIDMLEWFFGDIRSVQAAATTRLVHIETEDTGAAILKFTNGALGIIEATTATRPKDLEGSISILGETGSVVIGGFYMNELVTWNFTDHHPMDDEVFERHGRNPNVMGYNHAEYLKGVIESVETGKAALVDGLEARRSLELISAMYESIETGKEITIKFMPQKCRLGLPKE